MHTEKMLDKREKVAGLKIPPKEILDLNRNFRKRLQAFNKYIKNKNGYTIKLENIDWNKSTMVFIPRLKTVLYVNHLEYVQLIRKGKEF